MINRRPTWQKIALNLIDNGISNGRQLCFVGKGDLVDIKPKYKSELDHCFEGDGPYILEYIGQWGCGRRSMYIRTLDGKEPAVGIQEYMLQKHNPV